VTAASTVRAGMVVTLAYSVRGSDGHMVDEGEHPLLYLHGGHDAIFPKIEEALDGKAVEYGGDVVLPAAEAGNSFIPRLWARLRGKPAIIVHGRSDALVPVNHASRAYYAANHEAEGRGHGHGAAAEIDDVVVGHSRGTHRFTGTAAEAVVELRADLPRADSALGQHAHLVDAPTRPLTLVTRELVGRADRVAEPAVHAATRQFVRLCEPALAGLTRHRHPGPGPRCAHAASPPPGWPGNPRLKQFPGSRARARAR